MFEIDNDYVVPVFLLFRHTDHEFYMSAMHCNDHFVHVMRTSKLYQTVLSITDDVHSTSYGVFFNPKVLTFFLFLHENICCGYSLEAPHRGISNEYHNICFRGEIRKIFTGYPPLSRPMDVVT